MEPIYKKLQQFAAIRRIAPDILRETMNKVDDIVLSSTYKKEKALKINRNITENMGKTDNLDTLIGIPVLPTAPPPPHMSTETSSGRPAEASSSTKKKMLMYFLRC